MPVVDVIECWVADEAVVLARVFAIVTEEVDR